MTHYTTPRYLPSLLTMMLVALTASASGTAADELETVAHILRQASGITADFTLTSGGHSVSGTLQAQGKKFALLTPATSTWYDGATMTVYSSASREATVWTPTEAELAESNPLLYISMTKDFKVSYGKVGENEKELVLTPRRRGGSVKSVRITIGTMTRLPKAIAIEAGGGSTKISISKLNVGNKFAAGVFTFPKSKYPGVKITDLR